MRSYARVVCIIIFVSLLLVAGAAQVSMGGTDPVTGRWRRTLVALVGQEVAHIAVAAGADLQGQRASCIKARLA